MAKLLIVDDDELMVNMYTGKFKDDGYDVAVAFDGKEGLKKTEEYKPDLILLDIMMPTMDGLTTLSKLKENKETNKIPVILLTNVGASREDVDQGLGLGAVAYIVKSHFTPKQVVLKIREVLESYTTTQVRKEKPN